MATWLPATADGTSEFERVLGLRPNLRADYQSFTALFRSLRPVDPALLEMCRLRVAEILGSSARVDRTLAPAAQLSDEKIATLAEWSTRLEFSARERACLGFAEKFALDPHGVTDADAAAVTAHLSAEEMVAFVEALALFDGFTRFRLILGVAED